MEPVVNGHRSPLIVAAALLVTLSTATAVRAQQAPLEPGEVMVFGTIGFQSDIGGSLNEAGIGSINGARAEINTNTWGERYDAALLFRVGGAYNASENSQVFATAHWEQAEADTAVVGLVGGQPLSAKFGDYQSWGIDVGYRYYFAADLPVKPFASAAVGFQRVQNIPVTLSSGSYDSGEVPFYDDSWVFGWRIGGGFTKDLTPRFGIIATLDLRYSGVLSDQAGIGTVGFERINTVGNRWTLPLLGGVYFKF